MLLPTYISSDHRQSFAMNYASYSGTSALSFGYVQCVDTSPELIPAAARRKAQLRDSSFVGNAGSNPTGGLDVCFCECCILSGRSLGDRPILGSEQSYRLCVCMCVCAWLGATITIYTYTYNEKVEEVRRRNKDILKLVHVIKMQKNRNCIECGRYRLTSAMYRGADKSLARPTFPCIFSMVRIFRLMLVLLYTHIQY